MLTITVSKSDLLSRLQSVSKIISPKPVLPVMSCFLFEVEGRTLTITAADTTGRIKTTIDGINADGDISVCYNAQILINALKTLAEQPVTFCIDIENLKTSIKYQGGKFEMMGMNISGFLEEKKIKDAICMDIPASILLDGINKTLFCAANDELRPVMNSVYINTENDTISFAASDGHKLAMRESKQSALFERMSFVLPSKMAGILKSLVSYSDDQLELSAGLNNIRLTCGLYEITAQLLEGIYPNYRSVIPVNNNKTLVISTDTLKNALARILVFTSQVSHLIKFSMDAPILSITGQDIDYSTSADEKINCEYNGGRMEIGFNGNFLHQIISAIDSPDITMTFSEPNRAVLITPSDNDESDKLTYLIMPLTINN